MRKIPNYHKASLLITVGFTLFLGAANSSLTGAIAGFGLGLVIYAVIWYLAIAVKN